MNDLITIKDDKVSIDFGAVKAHLLVNNPAGDEEGSWDADNASRGLTEVRAKFYGTPLEDFLTQVIELCDAVSESLKGE